MLKNEYKHQSFFRANPIRATTICVKERRERESERERENVKREILKIYFMGEKPL